MMKCGGIPHVQTGLAALFPAKLTSHMAFPTTCWTMLADATLDGDPVGREALTSFCQEYRKPVEASLRRYGVPAEQVEDHLQDFFLKLMRGRLWKRADASRGRFRTFLLTILHNMLLHHWRAGEAQKRGSGMPMQSLDEDGAEFSAPTEEQTHQFDRDWALHLVDQALAKLEAEFVTAGNGDEFEVLKRFLPGSEDPVSMEEAALLTGVSEGSIRVSVHRMRRRFREILRAAVARTVSAPHEVDEELRYLGRLLMTN